MSSSNYNINNGGDYYPLSSSNLNSTSAITNATVMEYSTMPSSSPGSMSSSPAYPAAYQAPSPCYVADPNQLYYQQQLAHNGNDMLVQAHAQAYQAQCFAWFQQQYSQLSPSSFPHPMVAHHAGFIPPPPSFLHHQHQQHPRAPSEKRRGARTPFSDSQLYALRTRFEQCDTIKVDERRKLGAVIGLSPEQIKIWFQNRRFKLRKEKYKQIKQDAVQQQKSAKEEAEEDQKHVIS
ncbi:Homeobox protein ceh-51 [Caenorhabditis elegans]|uniref:Homeobox protein ceh-51 n=1 Tax=Caenorhabditis elegans TaxID=6239 RepID=CEH51_CAEEL|nr:Homeobox protein ceh-51 [Caenorhabditis elegans]Q9U1R1.1 RecName: Full=Homeobox protein ceh-51 [Caenorhabditis elegans]CAB60440.1 Homeobox protein ceh-51 [Caenorhabditis elegans]|eukprot:NP_507685.1 C. Elegans Homeobox [Caenorhabditis elegans]